LKLLYISIGINGVILHQTIVLIEMQSVQKVRLRVVRLPRTSLLIQNCVINETRNPKGIGNLSRESVFIG
jgi:hypothetical protein